MMLKPLLFTGILWLASLHAQAKSQPNVVLMLADDAGWGDYSVHGNAEVKTPHIDSLSHQGVSMENFFVCPVCSPTRAELLTGRWFPRTGVTGVSTGQERMNLAETTLAQVLKRANYATGIFGKWHNGSQWPYHPMARGFDEFFGYTSGHWGEYQDPPLEHNGQPIRGKGYIVDLCTDQALAFIRKSAGKPFFCYVPFTTPHSPWKVPEEDWARWKDREIGQLASSPKEEKLDETRCALAMLENQDRNVGRILALLDEMKLTQDTIVIYLSDNGPNTWRWNGGMRGRKGGVDEGGHKTAFFIRWPGQLPQGHKVPEIASGIDVLPTLMRLLNLPHTAKLPLDGLDLSPLLQKLPSAEKWPDRPLFTAWGKDSTLRTQRWRLRGGQLFDMLADPGQLHACNQEFPDVLAKLTHQLEAWKQDVGLVTTKGRDDVDDRPLPVGFTEFPRTWLPARDASPHGGVARSAPAPNSSYFVNWTSTEDAIRWDLDVATAGDYTVELLYTCPQADVGAEIEFSAKEAKLTTKVADAWDPPLYANQDTITRPKAESRMKEFKPLHCGKLSLAAGRQVLSLRATQIPGKTVMDLRALTLTLLPTSKN